MIDKQPIKVSDTIAAKIAEIDVQITEAKSESIIAAQMVADMKLKQSMRTVRDLQTLKKQLEDMQSETLADEAESEAVT